MEINLKNSKPSSFPNTHKSFLFWNNSKRATDSQAKLSINPIKAPETSRYLEDPDKEVIKKSSSHCSIDLQNFYTGGYLLSKESFQELNQEALSKRLSNSSTLPPSSVYIPLISSKFLVGLSKIEPKLASFYANP